jgi:serine/threonine protein kinase
LLYLSRLGIIHRDVKVSNIFIDKDQYKLGDFGFAIRANKIFKDVAIGSPVYMSP